MFDDLDASLAALLADGAAPQEVSNADVSFTVPDKDFSPGQATLDLFLHEVQENRALRETAPILQPVPAGGWQSERPPLRIDCTYLVTAWSPSSGAQRAAEEHPGLAESVRREARRPASDSRVAPPQAVARRCDARRLPW